MTDDQGPPVAGAAVEVTRISPPGDRRQAQTNESGKYIVVGLPVGRGFATANP